MSDWAYAVFDTEQHDEDGDYVCTEYILTLRYKGMLLAVARRYDKAAALEDLAAKMVSDVCNGWYRALREHDFAADPLPSELEQAVRAELLKREEKLNKARELFQCPK